MSRPVLSVEALRDWLITQLGETEYEWHVVDGCLLCRYLRAVGMPVQYVGSSSWCDVWGREHRLPGAKSNSDLDHPMVRVAKPWPWTYAAALERAEALLTTGRS